MKADDVKIGQIWRRKDGREVKLTAERTLNWCREFELTPIGTGRKSWKWDGGIASELEFVSSPDAEG